VRRSFLTPAGQRLLWALALFTFLAAGFFSFFLPADLGGQKAPVLVTVERGLSSGKIGRRLEEKGLIRSRWAFRLAALAKGKTSFLKAGTYQLSASETLWELIDHLSKGDVAEIELTIPEGLTAREIADRAAPVLACTPEAFLAAVHDSATADSLRIPTRSLEGYLFPDTYRVIPGTPPRDFVRRLVARMTELYETRFAARADSMKLSRHQALTLASMVEAEARMDQERPRIAAVFLNRLKTGMRLQSDPTVAYVLGRRVDRIYQKDLLVNSPYNTYLVAGLPPGPICSPGESSIRAALYPTPGSRDYYFVATGDGGHLFSQTNEQHNEARRRVAGNHRFSRRTE
jgi:UPF0755 protein